MDKTDLEILKILQKKARIPNVEVSRTIGMAPSAVLERIKKLEAKNIIQGYEVRLNPDMFGCAMTAFVSIQVTRPSKVVITSYSIHYTKLYELSMFCHALMEEPSKPNPSSKEASVSSCSYNFV